MKLSTFGFVQSPFEVSYGLQSVHHLHTATHHSNFRLEVTSSRNSVLTLNLINCLSAVVPYILFFYILIVQ